MHSKILLWSVVWVLLPVVATAQDAKEALIQALYVKSGIERQMSQMPALLQVGFDQAVASDERLRELPRAVRREIRASIATVFAVEDIKKTIMGACRESLSVDDLKDVLGWLDSPVGRKFTQLEEAASSPEQYLAMQRFAQQLQESPPRPERLKILKQLDAAVKATESAVELALNTQLAIAVAISASLPKEQQPAYDRLTEMIEQTRPQIQAVMQTQTLVSMLFTYKDLADAELGRYLAFAVSHAGAKYHAAYISGFKKALLAGSFRWGEAIADILRQSAGKNEI